MDYYLYGPSRNLEQRLACLALLQNRTDRTGQLQLDLLRSGFAEEVPLCGENRAAGIRLTSNLDLAEAGQLGLIDFNRLDLKLLDDVLELQVMGVTVGHTTMPQDLTGRLQPR